MAKLTLLLAAMPLLAHAATNSSDCCKFTISSTAGDFDCPASELLDGQIRLNGTYDTSTFCISSSGGITNSRGFGCIITDAPTTQFQCDEGKPPTTGFSVGANNTLLYKGSSAFYVCPATDTEYNIYINPNFGQKKCSPVTLQTDGCGSASCPPPPERETVWMTEWATSTVNYKITETWTSLVPCSTSTTLSLPPPLPTNSTTGKPGCMKSGKNCTHDGDDTPAWTNDTFSAPVPPKTSETGTTGVLLPPATTGVNLPGSTELPGKAGLVPRLLGAWFR